MGRRRNLVAISSAQLLAGSAGQVLALRRGLAFDIALIDWKGRPDRIARDSWLLGTGFSAPVVMLAAQAAVTSWLAFRDSQGAARTLGVLGAAMTGGYLIERRFRTAMTPTGWDRTLTPVAVAGLGLCVPMAAVGLRSQPSDRLQSNATSTRFPGAL